MKYYMVFVCIALASFDLKSNCFPSRQTDNPCDDQPNGSFLTHPLGCKYFIVCNNGEVNMGSCPDGLAFNPSRPPCDLEENVNCDDSTTTPVTTILSTTRTPTTTIAPTTTTTTIAPTTFASTNAPTTPTTTITPTTPATAVAPTTSATTVAPTTSASTIAPTTPTTTITYTPTTTTAIEPVEPIESTTSTTSQITSTTTDPPTTTATTMNPTPTTTTTSKPIQSPEIKCPEQEDPKIITYLASNSECTKYYICYHNTPIEKTCSPNLHWNIKTQKCDTIEKAKCTVSTMPSFFPVCPRDAVGMYPHPLNCEWFLYCYHGHMTVQQCPFFYNWDSESQSCQLKTVAKCVLYSE